MKRHASKFGKTYKAPPEAKTIKRKVHKARLAQERLNEALNKSNPEPMRFMHKRAKELDKLLGNSTYRKPEHSPGTVQTVAIAVAEWDLSDPFAYGRTKLHAKQGYIDPLKVTDEMKQRTIARRVAKAREVERERTSAVVSES